jgi:hypothetical protein
MSVQFAPSGPSGVDLNAFANRAKEIEIGGVDDIVELGDDFGASLLSNPSKMPPSPKPGGGSVQLNLGGGGGGDIPQISIKPVDLDDVVNVDALPGASDIRLNRGGGGMDEPPPFVINTGSGGSGIMGSGSELSGGMSAEEESRKKQEYLTKLQRLRGSGLEGARMTMSNSLAEIKAEYDKLTDSRNLEASIRFQRNALMTFVSGVEMVNDKFGNRLPVKPRLKGWSESVHTNIEDFDEIFEELYDMYKDKAKMHPLLRLVGTLGVSATMYHLTNSMAERSGIPGMSDMMNEDPELQRIIMAKMAAKMGGLGQFMSAAGGFGGPQPMAPSMGGMNGSGPAPMGGAPRPPTPPGRGMGMDSRTGFNQAAAAASEAPRVRREMRGPAVDVSDLVKAFEMEAASQANAAPIAGAHAGVFTPSGPPPTPPRGVQILREGVGTRADPLSEFMDDASIGTSSTMNTERRRRGRPRAAVTPVGATLNLNV